MTVIIGSLFLTYADNYFIFFVVQEFWSVYLDEHWFHTGVLLLFQFKE
jgi:hypothetical protein